MIIEANVQNLTSKDAIEDFFAKELGYQVNPVPFDAAELEIPPAPAEFIRETEQLCNYQRLFQVYFMNVTSLRRTDLRKILEPFYSKHPVSNNLFVFTKDYNEIAFVSPLRMPAGDDTSKTKLHLRTLLVDRSNVYHTDLETLEQIRLSPEEAITEVIWGKHREAFDVERVTKDFFKGYSEVFADVERSVRGIPRADERHLFTQRLFNRLMFCWFLQKKDWLNHEQDYLIRRLRDAKSQGKNFFSDVLYFLFFWGMRNPADERMAEKGWRQLQKVIGEVPFLNGGLFEMNEDGWDVQGKVQIANDAFDDIFNRLFNRYNFTVEESTPLDVRVAVDPEMLGRVFEELVIERHSKGSYYTPRNVVSFMCRESLKVYLAEQLPNKDDAINALVDDHIVSGLSVADAKRIAAALDNIRVCDPACGSGAYLLGMLYELVELSRMIYNPDLQMEDRSLYEHKLNIIKNNLYGVDIDPFAVNIAMLRIWLSLAVDHEVDNIADVQPLPNLDFKIEVGDSLISPDPSGGDQPELRYRDILTFSRLKADYLIAYGSEKSELRRQIEELRSRIAKWAHSDDYGNGFDWAVDFAEVFAARKHSSATLAGSMTDVINAVPGQMELASSQEMGGFDVVLANPPYVRADAQFEHIKDEVKRQAAIAQWQIYRKTLRKSGIYQTIYEKWDLYVPFLERGFQLLRSGGVLHYIISDAYMAAKYANKSQLFLIENAAICRVDFVHDIQIFNAGVRNVMLCVQRLQNKLYEPLRVYHRDEFGNIIILPSAPQSEFGTRLFRPDGEKLVELRGDFVPLEMICYISVGMVINANERGHKGKFTAEDVLSHMQDSKHTKRFTLGKDILKWCVQRIRWLEWGTLRAPTHFRRPTFPQLHGVREKLIAMRTPGVEPKVAYDDQHLHFDASSVGFILWSDLAGVTNGSISKTAKYRRQSADGDRERREALSDQFKLKYLLAIMNSSFAQDWLSIQRRSNKHIYPDDWKQFPIPPLPNEDQEEFVSIVDAILAEFEQWGCPVPPIAAQRVEELESELNERVAALYPMTT